MRSSRPRKRNCASASVNTEVTGRSQLEEAAVRVVCAATPEPFYSVGARYRDYTQTTDEEVRQLLRRSQKAFAE